jgi:hypothetical protein
MFVYMAVYEQWAEWIGGGSIAGLDTWSSASAIEVELHVPDGRGDEFGEGFQRWRQSNY